MREGEWEEGVDLEPLSLRNCTVKNKNVLTESLPYDIMLELKIMHLKHIKCNWYAINSNQ